VSSIEEQPAHGPFYGLELSLLKQYIPLQSAKTTDPTSGKHPFLNTSPAEAGLSIIRTAAVTDSFIKMKKNKGTKVTSIETDEKRLRQFEKRFPWLPEISSLFEDYLE
jgi:hypothetical protein